MVDVAILVSVGRHPASGRARRAPSDARALELAFGLPPGRRDALHAGIRATRPCATIWAWGWSD